jgi:hypothetical protein
MLTFKKNWLYKYNEWCTGNWATRDNVHESKTLCPYFWGSIWNVIVVNIWYIFMFHAIGAICSLPLMEILERFFTMKGWSGLYIGVVSGYALATCVIFLIIVLVKSYIFLIESFLQKRKDREERKVETKPSVVVEYMKSVKSKVCPLIKFED